ncbi:hypothetical protein ASG49_02305 [Marmoricola sp. Leaf446]|uniref:YihY/virulence factor BrkB family protein n=1 Tax=Marmoricola sp. Leaf446 TaxID=1736379 RepID=UPI0006FD8F84|nr:YhjD/YihY/BrkB family envelope integrity protein [Marmoricola sp. Leaf446]KQT93821.1 hypothetical protein ASG49_02305 [Marmoricola sp. Leaf446]
MSTTTPTRPDAGSSRLQAQDPTTTDPAPEPASRRSPWFVLRRTLGEFREDRGSDLAGALTLWTLLAVVPGLALLLGLVGLTGQTGNAVTLVDDVLSRLLSGATVELVTGRLTELGRLSFLGSVVLVGVAALLLAWAANGYVRAFARVTNTVHEVPEGRPSWRLRPAQVVLTVAVVALAALALTLMVVTGPVAQALGDALGLSADVVGVWSVAQWPLLALVVVALVTLLLHATPNVKFGRIKLLTPGSFVAILVWVAASVGLAFFVATYGTYDRTVGAMAGVVVVLLWLWVTNAALVLGAELDAELERGRQLQHGLAAEERLQQPLRDDRVSLKRDHRRERDLTTQRDIRVAAAGHGNPADRPFGRASRGTE